MAKKIYGIDLGTTYSCIALVDQYGKPQVIPNSESRPITPSVVAFEEGGLTTVGEIAKEMHRVDSQNVVETVKRHMGERDFTFMFNDEEYTPETISAFILRKLVNDANEYTGENINDVVITCPAYFGQEQRASTRKAGEIAGLNVLDIINEPTAAAIAYGLNNDDTEQTVMVYDLGGGTFDITVMKIKHGDFNVVATDGDHLLGGKDWDESIIQKAIASYCEESGANEDDIYDEPELYGDLLLQAEEAKKMLSQRPKSIIKINGKRIEITRQVFEDLTRGLLESTVKRMHDVMGEAAKKGVTRYDKILLVGGSTRMPQVKERLTAEFPGISIETFDPDQSVAKGAALWAMQLSETKHKLGNASAGGKAPVVTNVLSHSIAIKLWNDDDTYNIVNQILKNTEIPTEHVLQAGTHSANQTSVLVEVYENGSSDKNVPEHVCKKLVEGEMGPLPAGLPAGAPIDIIFKIDGSGLLNIDITHKPSGVTSHVVVKLANQLSEEETAREKEKFNRLRLQ